MNTTRHSSGAGQPWCRSVKLTDIATLAVRLKTCLHFYLASLPVGTALSLLLLVTSFYLACPTDAMRPMVAIVAYIALCGSLFCGATLRALNTLRDLRVVARWYGGTRTLSLLVNASYPLALMAVVVHTVAPPHLAIPLLDTLALHIVMSCVVRDGLGTVLSVAAAVEHPVGEAAP